MPQSQVLSVFQDASGRLWIGTNQGGVARYDGTPEIFNETNGLANNVVYSITQGNEGNLYIGTGNGLSVYDGKKFKNYTIEKGLSHNGVVKVFKDKRGKILLGTGKGVCVLEGDTVIPFKLDWCWIIQPCSILLKTIKATHGFALFKMVYSNSAIRN